MTDFIRRLDELLTPEWTPAREIAATILEEGWVSNRREASTRVSGYYMRLYRCGIAERQVVKHTPGGIAFTEWRLAK